MKDKVNFDIFFSVIIVNYNYAHLIERAILSVLHQTYSNQNYEIIIVDDGSTDHSRDILQKYASISHVNLKLINHQGQLAAFKEGIKHSRYDWICLLDSDDEFTRNKLEKVASFIQTHKEECLYIAHDLMMVDSKKGVTRKWFDYIGIHASHLDISHCEYNYPFSIPCGQIYHKKILKPFIDDIDSKTWMQGADNPINWGALFISGRIYYLSEVLGFYHVHGRNHFMDSTLQGFAPKLNYLDRWQALINFLENFDKITSHLYLTPSSRRPILQFLKKCLE